MSEPMRDIGSMLVAYCEQALSAEGREWVEAQLATLPELRERLVAIEAVRGQLHGALPPAPAALSGARRELLRAHAMARHPRRSALRRWVLAACLVLGVGGAALLTVMTSQVRESARLAARDEGQAPVRVAALDSDASPPAAAPMPESTMGQDGDQRTPVTTVLAVPSLPIATHAANPSRNPSGQAILDEEAHTAAERKIYANDGDQSKLPQQDVQMRTRYTAIPNGNESAVDDSGVAGAQGQTRDMDPQGYFAAIGKIPDLHDELAKADKDAYFNLDAKLAETDDTLNDDIDKVEVSGPNARIVAGGGRWTDSNAVKDDFMASQPALGDDATVLWQQPTGLPPSHSAHPGTPVPGEDGLYARWLAGLDAGGESVPSSAFHAGRADELAAALPAGACTDRQLLAAARAAEFASTDVGADDALGARASNAPTRSHGGEPLGAALVAAARRSGLQVALEGGGIVLRSANAALDPTLLGGMSPAQFSAAFATAPLARIARDPVMTFAPVADTASFHQARAALDRGMLPDPRIVAVEQFVNALAPSYPHASGGQTFTCYAEGGPAPFAAGPLANRTALVALGIVTRAAAPGERRAVHLCVVCDCSGSMGRPGGLDRARLALGTVARSLGSDDTMALVRFADQAEVALPPTSGRDQARILAALDHLDAHGATDVDEGIALAFQLAAEDDAPLAEERVVLLTDGATPSLEHQARILSQIAACRARGIMLTIVGCGSSDRDEHALQDFADHAHAHVAVLPSDAAAVEFANRELVPAQLQVLARDTKVQVRWNPSRVAWARLVGYERHRLAASDFRNESIAAAVIAPESQVTALFELVLTDEASGPLGDAAVRCFDTRAGAVREQHFPIPGATLAAAASPRLVTIGCAAELGELLGRTWWSNRALATWRDLERTLEAQPPSDANRLMLTMASQAQHLDGCP